LCSGIKIPENKIHKEIYVDKRILQNKNMKMCSENLNPEMYFRNLNLENSKN